MTVVWIKGPGTKWHLGRLREARGLRTGKVYSRHHVTACSGRQLGGPWGYSRAAEPKGETCERCEALARSAEGTP